MVIRTIKIPEHFYLYCALLFNNNETVRYSKNTEDLKTKITEILERNNLKHTPMPDHRYQYLLSVLNSENYEPTEDIRKSHYDVLKYVKNISELPDMQKLWEMEKKKLSISLESYNKPIQAVINLFRTNFDFEPNINKFYITRNWDKSGMCIPTKNAFYIIASWSSSEPNVRNIIHEIMHAYVDEVDLPVTETIKDIISNLPNNVFSNYKKAHTIVYESLVRALVVYLCGNDSNVEPQELSEDDKELQLPQQYLERLNIDDSKMISKEYLSKLEI